jgi:catechol 2,3-dioxygenase-like lactoylglutathione lyase family enzyme
VPDATDQTATEPPASAAVVHHVGLTVGDLDRSVAFYGEFFGLSTIGRNRIEGEAISEQTGLPGTVIETALLAGENTIVEFLCYHSPEGLPDAPRPCDVGAGHVCMVVDDVEAVLSRMRRAGVPCHAQPCSLIGRERMVYVRDPDGIMIELLEPTPDITLAALLASAKQET